MNRSSTLRRVGGIVTCFAVSLLVVVPLVAYGQTSTTEYLGSTGVPQSGFQSNSPSGSLPNHDPSRNSDPGLTLAKTTPSSSESDPTKYQLWARPAASLSLDGPASLTVTAAMKDLSSSKSGQLTAYLLECNASLTVCETISSGSVSATPWSPTGGWETRTITFGTVTYEFSPGASLAVKLLVNDSIADDDMWIAYDASLYPSHLTYTEETEATTTTTEATTTTTEATTTTTEATTTTTEATTTTTSEATTTTSEATTTTTGLTTTTVATTTTGAITTSTEGTGPGATNTESPSDGVGASGSSNAGPDETNGLEATSDDNGFGRNEPESEEENSDLVLAGVSETTTAVGDETESGLLHAVDLVLPDSVARLVVSPFIVLKAIAEAILSTGAAVSIPASAAGFTVGLLIILVDRRRPWQVVDG